MSRRLVISSAVLLAWTQAGYGAALALLARRPEEWPVPAGADGLPLVSLVVAAYREEAVIAAKVRNARALDWPAERLEVIVAVDGGDAQTVKAARAAGADRVLARPRAGKYLAQDAAVRQARGEVLAFSDANAFWAPDALRELVAPILADPRVGYVCGRPEFVAGDGTNQEGLYWRYELWLRERESRWHSVTAGNGAVYAVRRSAYGDVDPALGHDLAMPFQLVKRGWRAVYAPRARAREKMVPSIEGEWRRKRRMMRQAWPIIVRGGLLDPRGYPPRYAFAILSHRALRYASPALHAAMLLGALRRPRLLAPQLALLAAAAAGGRVRSRPLLVARYYVLTTASIAAGLHDWLRHGRVATWETPEGTR